MPRDRSALQTLGLYTLVVVAWVLLSDRILLVLAPDLLASTWVGTWVGVVFLTAMACIIYLLSSQWGSYKKPVNGDETRGFRNGERIFVFAVLTSVITLIGFGFIAHTSSKQRSFEIERLQAIADLKVGQIVAWFDERNSDAQIIRNNDSLVVAFQEWSRSRSPVARRQLEEQLQLHNGYKGYLEIILLGPDGAQISSSANISTLTKLPELSEAIKQAQVTGKLVTTDLYRIAERKTKQVHLDFVVPVYSDNGRPALTIVLRTDPNRFLFPFIQSWPIPSASAETLLFRREGSHVLFLNELRHRSETSLRLTVPIEGNKLLAAQVLRSEVSDGQPVEGVDYRAIPVLGVAKAIPGTSWFLVAKIDKDELYAVAKREAGWIALAATLVLIVAGIATIVLRQREDLRNAKFQRKEQEEKLQALQLLQAIAEGSTDAIYAKDGAGRYIWLNRELCRFLGKSREEILGRDDREIFPSEDAERISNEDQKTMEVGLVSSVEESLSTTGGRRGFLTTRGPLRDTEGRIMGLFGIARDITERKFQEREIRAGETRFRAIFDGVNDGIILHDLGKGTILEANARLMSMFGYDREEIRRLTIADISADTPPYSHARLLQWVEDASHGESPVFEWLAQHKDSHHFLVEISMRRAEVSGRSCVLVLIRNALDRHQSSLERNSS